MMFYLTLWFPKAYRARLSGLFVLAQPVAFILGGPLAAAILAMDGTAGLRGWQWLFLIEGIPAIILALAAQQWLPNGPEQAEWLDADAKRVIGSRLGAETGAAIPESVSTALLDVRVWLLAIPIFAAGSAQYGVALWLPQIVSAMGFSNSATGLIVAASYFAAMVAIVAVSFSSDRRGERLWHVAFCWVIAAAAFIAASLSPNDSAILVALTLANAAILGEIAPLFAIPTNFLTGQACASAMALMNVFASLGGLVAPVVIGALREQSGDYRTAMGFLAVQLVLAVLLLMGFRLAMSSRRLPLSHAKTGDAA
jgi:ACS family tartrate transporter-like MFS transporter